MTFNHKEIIEYLTVIEKAPEIFSSPTKDDNYRTVGTPSRSMTSNDLYKRLSQPQCKLNSRGAKVKIKFPKSTSLLQGNKYKELSDKLFTFQTTDSLDFILPVRSSESDHHFYEEFVTELGERGSVSEIYNDQTGWTTFTDNQFGLISKIHSAKDGLEVRVDDMVGFILDSLKFTSPPRPMATKYSKGKKLVTVTDIDKVAIEAAREVFCQGKVEVNDVYMSSTPDLVYYIFGEYSELPSTGKTCIFLIENKRAGAGGNKFNWDRQLCGEMLILALKNYDLVIKDNDANLPPFFPMYGVQFHGTVMRLFYVAFSCKYLSAVQSGVFPSCAEQVLVFDKVIVPHKSIADQNKIDLSGQHFQRKACFDILLRLKAYSRCIGGNEEPAILDPPVFVSDHRLNPGESNKACIKSCYQFLLSFEGFGPDENEWVTHETKIDAVDLYLCCICAGCKTYNLERYRNGQLVKE